MLSGFAFLNAMAALIRLIVSYFVILKTVELYLKKKRLKEQTVNKMDDDLMLKCKFLCV